MQVHKVQDMHSMCRTCTVCAGHSMCRTQYVQDTVCAGHSMCRTQYVQDTVCAGHSMCRTQYVCAGHSMCIFSVRRNIEISEGELSHTSHFEFFFTLNFILQRSPFSCLGRGLVTVLTMVVGELDYLDAFGFSYQVVDSDDPGVYRTHLRASLIIWIPFVILIPLVLNNMLVRGLCSIPYCSGYKVAM